MTISPLHQIQSGAQVRYIHLIWTGLQLDAVYYAASQVAQQETASCGEAAPLQLVGNGIGVYRLGQFRPPSRPPRASSWCAHPHHPAAGGSSGCQRAGAGRDPHKYVWRCCYPQRAGAALPPTPSYWPKKAYYAMWRQQIGERPAPADAQPALLASA